jgi:hypothetical protein
MRCTIHQQSLGEKREDRSVNRYTIHQQSLGGKEVCKVAQMTRAQRYTINQQNRGKEVCKVA